MRWVNKMNDRERLIEFIDEAQLQCDDNYGITNSTQMADYLISKGIIVPPVKVGDIVYHLFPKQGIVPHRIRRIQLNSKGLWLFDKNGAFSINKIGKTIFLTYEKAEKALKEIRDNYNKECE